MLLRKGWTLQRFMRMMAASAVAFRPRFSLPEKHVALSGQDQILGGDCHLQNNCLRLTDFCTVEGQQWPAAEAEHGVVQCLFRAFSFFFFSTTRSHRVPCQTLTWNTEKNLHGLKYEKKPEIQLRTKICDYSIRNSRSHCASVIYLFIFFVSVETTAQASVVSNQIGLASDDVTKHSNVW